MCFELIKVLKHQTNSDWESDLCILTVKASNAACDQDTTVTLSLHPGQEGLDGLDGAQKVDF